MRESPTWRQLAAAMAAARASSSTRRPGARSTCSTSTASFPPEQVVYASRLSLRPVTRLALIALRPRRLAGSRRRSAARHARRHGGGARRRHWRCPSRRRRSARGTLVQPMQLARIHQYLSMATPLLWTRQPDTVGVLGLAINACAERNGYADAGRPHPRAARGGARPLADAARVERRGRPARRDAPDVPADPPRRHRGGDGRCLSCRQRAPLRAGRAASARRSRRRCATRSG